ncbi:hypothetical protein [Burkholderia cepacia]|uniref:hypothetical protein n=1 Tax=Burkholderia cepacia TaxID=292 RepID=UPI000A8D901D|nr:hypothetical protein [Burkholderia cepacia]
MPVVLNELGVRVLADQAADAKRGADIAFNEWGHLSDNDLLAMLVALDNGPSPEAM